MCCASASSSEAGEIKKACLSQSRRDRRERKQLGWLRQEDEQYRIQCPLFDFPLRNQPPLRLRVLERSGREIKRCISQSRRDRRETKVWWASPKKDII